jgi:hypothetical protein
VENKDSLEMSLFFGCMMGEYGRPKYRPTIILRFGLEKSELNTSCIIGTIDT